MPHCIARIFELLLRLLLPAPGRHRSAETVPVPTVDVSMARLPRVSVLRGEDSGLVRPYLLAHERRQQERRQRARRRALVLATYGVDIGPRRIHGMKVTAR
ncbi:hypothetical protein [Streptomyces violaceusniger]|uniref:Uncharacterized protein n=1 Tax=Streptomyces violaceusniger (strain Tu 4113) TaxID=653045 RepID=G2PB89_STRV4|nr:hypothetical protein [Streptomyces violaceusniger]AEM80141.1 hypothetical protein Strvi_0353 [Streptomyces violaceusniger Tu 4113]